MSKPMLMKPAKPAASVPLDVEAVRADFPILGQKVHRKPLVYLDNASTTQKPAEVMQALDRFYSTDNANVHRGVHLLSQRATDDFEKARAKVQRFIHAPQAHEVIFVRGTTEGINLIAQTFGRQHVGAGDEVLISTMEHHSNIVPWQMLCDEKKAHLRVVPINDRGEFLLDEYEKLLTPKTKLISVVHVSNSLGTINPVREIIKLAHERNIPVVLDGAQAVAHLPVNVQELGCDFYVFSGHKLYGPTGIGVLWGKERHLKAMPPYQGGGDMIRSVSFAKTTYNDLPYKFEAGTPDIAGAVGLGAAIDWVSRIGIEAIARHEHDLLDYATEVLAGFPGLRLVGTAAHKAGILSFVMDGHHPHDIGTILDREGIAIRTGHHCTQPLMDRLGVPATARASLAVYNTREEIDALARGLHHVEKVMG